MDTDEILNKGIGNLEKESNSLKPAKVTITAVNVEKKVTKEDKEVVLIEFSVKHPDAEDAIKISKVKQLLGDKLYCNTTWYTTDKEGNIQTGSPLANLLKFAQVKNLSEMVNKELDTIEESEKSHYLAFKAYQVSGSGVKER